MSSPRRNEPRSKLIAPRAGEPIRESFLAGVTQAINQRRGSCDPASQVMIPAAGSGKIKFKSWCQIDRANPTVNQNLNGATLNMNSDKNNDYDGTTNDQKMIFNFEQAVTTPSGASLFIYFGSAPTIDVTASISSFGFSPGDSHSMAATVRIRPITASFTTSAQTWNNFASLTLGSALTFTTTSSLGGTTGAQTINSWSTDGELAKLIVVPNALSAVYGYVIDIKPVSSVATGTQTLSSISATGKAANLTTAAPYLAALR